MATAVFMYGAAVCAKTEFMLWGSPLCMRKTEMCQYFNRKLKENTDATGRLSSTRGSTATQGDSTRLKQALGLGLSWKTWRPFFTQPLEKTTRNGSPANCAYWQNAESSQRRVINGLTAEVCYSTVPSPTLGVHTPPFDE